MPTAMRPTPELNVSPGHYAGATLTIQRDGGPNADDSISATGSLDLADHNSSGENVSLDGGATFIGKFVDTGLGSVTFTFNANAAAADIDLVMRQVAYANGSHNPPTSVSIDFIFDDGNGSPGGQAQGTGSGATTATVNVQVTQVDDAPALSNVALTQTYATGTAGVTLSPALHVSDPDATPPSTLTESPAPRSASPAACWRAINCSSIWLPRAASSSSTTARALSSPTSLSPAHIASVDLPGMTQPALSTSSMP